MQIKSYLFIILLLATVSGTGICQVANMVFTPSGTIGKESGITLLVQNVRNPCGNNLGVGRKKTTFRLHIPANKVKTYNSSGQFYLTLRLSIEDCNGKRRSNNYSIKLDKIGNDGELRNDKEWRFEGAKLISFDGFVKEIIMPPTCKSQLPESIMSSADDAVAPGDIVELSAGDDGFICPNAEWEWMADECESGYGIQAGRNSKVIVSPKTTTTYYLRIREGSQKSPCISHVVYVTASPPVVDIEPEPERLPVIISGAPEAEICPNTPVRLLVSGGLEGNNNIWVWRKDSCSGQILGRGSALDLKPDKSMGVFASDEGDSLSECKKSEIRIKKPEPPIDLMINKGLPHLSICEGDSAQLIASNLPGNSRYKLMWTDDQNRILSQNTTFLSVSPVDNTRYYLKGEGECNTNTKTSVIEVKVTKKSKSPDSVIESKMRGRKYKFSVRGGYLESGAFWKWYKGNSCDSGEYLGAGAEIIKKVKNPYALYVRAEGGRCGSSSCYKHTMAIDNKNPGFWFFNVGIFDERFDNLSLTVGSKRLYLRYKTSIKKFDVPYEITQNTSGDYLIPDFPNQGNSAYAFNGNKASIRTGYTGGVMIGGRIVRLYLGGGYGEMNTLWGLDVIQNNDPASIYQTWGSVQNKHYKGLEAEGGLFIRAGYLNFMGGVNMIYDQKNGNYFEGTVGVGVTFK